ncbi:uncharacterized protein SCHCODRAFT_02555280 [Schizophyllum commune H4-8]|uniref:uncharacterized protein n=1 Tax=Schizophyllum commune (strain H4-8 / FGSC 9210) TaxID=578458 RepID=UPI00215DDF79|nr:uncharacterized protein SCHCODRAFT_02555280 [Schizophyllum commune H4-8]KAI5886375.1 hypothetical protein SCHCODRAFT_02555280 [Schizophyllum commune H4-8]
MKHPRVAQAETELLTVSAKLDVLHRRQADLQRVIDETLRLKRSIDDELKGLEERRHELEREKLPISWLPNEVLARVFTAAADYDLASISEAQDEVAAQRRALPIALSHVCSRWRSVALGTRELWSFILIVDVASASLPPDHSLPKSASAFLKRSGDACLLDVCIMPPPPDPKLQVSLMNIFVKIPCRRMRALLIRCREPSLAGSAVFAINNNPVIRRTLKYLDISLLSDAVPSRALFLARDRKSEDPGPSQLTSLRLRRIPVATMHSCFFVGLRRLELSFPPSSHRTPIPAYYLTVSGLRMVLKYASHLEELILCDAAPVFDQQPDAGNYQTLSLTHLRRLEWSYPMGSDVQRLLYIFDFPALEDLDISAVRNSYDHTIAQMLPPHLALWQEPAEYRCLQMPKLDRLALTCLDGAECLLRQCDTTQLKRLELVGGTARLENFLRDPRLTQLTHLLLSEVDIEPAAADHLLGYLPQLVSLTLEHVGSVDPIFVALQKTNTAVPGAAGGLATTPATSVRYCPRLKEITLWNCVDVTGPALYGVVRVRNGLGGPAGSEASAVLAPRSAGLSTRPATPNTQRALRRLPGKRQDVVGAQRPCKIERILVEDCPGIGVGVLKTLRGLGIAGISL